MLAVALGDVSGKGVPAALYSVFAAELVRGRTFRRRYLPERSSAGERAVVGEHDPPSAPARGVLLHAVLRRLRSEATDRDAGQLRPAVSRFARPERGVSQIELPGVPLGSFPGSTYDEVTFALHTGDLFVFCSDGVFEAMNANGAGIHRRRGCSTSWRRSRDLPPRDVVARIFAAVEEFRSGAPPNDDMTAVAVRITT